MFDLILNTTPKLYQFIIENNLQFKVNNNMILCPFNQIHDGILYSSFYQMFTWYRTPEGFDYWVDRLVELNQYNPQNVSNFKFLKGSIPRPIRYYSMARGSLYWVPQMISILYYLEEEEEDTDIGLINLNLKSQYIEMYYERYNSFDDFMISNRNNLILIYNIIDENGNIYTKHGLHLLDHSIPIIVALHAIVIEPHDRTNYRNIPSPSRDYPLSI